MRLLVGADSQLSDFLISRPRGSSWNREGGVGWFVVVRCWVISK